MTRRILAELRHYAAVGAIAYTTIAAVSVAACTFA